jgi:hypothetical protein
LPAAVTIPDPRCWLRPAQLIPKAELFLSDRGSHLAMWDDQETAPTDPPGLFDENIRGPGYYHYRDWTHERILREAAAMCDNALS